MKLSNAQDWWSVRAFAVGAVCSYAMSLADPSAWDIVWWLAVLAATIREILRPRKGRQQEQIYELVEAHKLERMRRILAEDALRDVALQRLSEKIEQHRVSYRTC